MIKQPVVLILLLLTGFCASSAFGGEDPRCGPVRCPIAKMQAGNFIYGVAGYNPRQGDDELIMSFSKTDTSGKLFWQTTFLTQGFGSAVERYITHIGRFGFSLFVCMKSVTEDGRISWSDMSFREADGVAQFEIIPYTLRPSWRCGLAKPRD